MQTQRTGGMIAIGVLNIIVGAGGLLLAVLMLVGGGLAMAAGPAFEAEGGAELSGMATAAGGMMMGIGFALMLLWGGLAVAGIGVLMLRSWGRALSMLCGIVITPLSGWAIFQGGFDVMTTAMFVYGICLVGVFMRPEWKFAFAGSALGAGASMPTSMDVMPGRGPRMAGVPDAPSGGADDDGLPSILGGRTMDEAPATDAHADAPEPTDAGAMTDDEPVPGAGPLPGMPPAPMRAGEDERQAA